MKFIKHTLMLIAMAVSMFAAQAQQRNFRISLLEGPPASIDSLQSAMLKVSVRNIDTAVYSGTLSFLYTINGTVYTSSAVSGLQYDSVTTVINPGDSIIDSMMVHTNGPAFLTGPSVVVIWPMRIAGDQIYALDSIKFGIQVNAIETGIGEIIEGALYYNNGRIMLREAGKNELMQVRIWNTIGAEMYYTEGEHAQYIELPDLPAGMYIAEAILSNNKRAILKFVKPLH